MEKELILLIKKFIRLCDELYENNKIDEALYIELTQYKNEFLKKYSVE